MTNRQKRTVSVLCASRDSIYHGMENVEVYDEDRGARTFPGNTPIVAHPPCRAWSAFCSQQAKPAEGERELAFWCVDMLRRCGGVLEQPAHSRLFEAASLPLPGEPARDGVWSLAVKQSWWGHPVSKRTWLCFFHVPPICVETPFVLRCDRGDCKRWNRLSKRKRAATSPRMARWLVHVARQSFSGGTSNGHERLAQRSQL